VVENIALVGIPSLNVICFIKKRARPKRKFLNSTNVVPPQILVHQHSNFPFPLPIRTPLGLRVNGKCGNAKNHTALRVRSDCFAARFKNNLKRNNWSAVKCTGFKRSKPAPPKFKEFCELLKAKKRRFFCLRL
jgi:hypothetical protein